VEKDPKLRKEFEQKIESDSTFAKNPEAILQFFMQKVRQNVEPNANRYPVSKLFLL